MNRRTYGDETWSRLLEWTNGQKASERLAGHVLRALDYSGIDPIHPLGGKDGHKDGRVIRDGQPWIMAAYFPRGQQTYTDIEKKLLSDIEGVKANNAMGMAFVTNQELRESERKKLRSAARDIPLDLVHLERLTHVLNSPESFGTRLEYLHIEMNREEQVSFFAWLQNKQKDEIIGSLQRNNDDIVGFATGGNTFPDLFAVQEGPVIRFGLFKRGQYPLFDVTVSVCDVTKLNEEWSKLGAPPTFNGVTPGPIMREHHSKMEAARTASTFTKLLGKVTKDSVSYYAIHFPSTETEFWVECVTQNGVFIQKLHCVFEDGKPKVIRGEKAERFYYHPELNSDAALQGGSLRPRFPSEVEAALDRRRQEQGKTGDSTR